MEARPPAGSELTRGALPPPADLLRALHVLEPDASTATQIARLLDPAWAPPPAGRGHVGQRVDAPPQVPFGGDADGGGDGAFISGPEQEEATDAPILLSSFDQLSAGGEQPPSWFAVGGLPVDQTREERAPREPLILRTRARGVLVSMLSAPMRTRRIDIPEAVRMMSRGLELRRLPHARVRAVAPRVQLLVDRSEAMLPFLSDLDALAADVVRVVGEDRVELLRFAGCPDRGAGAGSRRTWSDDYRRHTPQPGTCVVVASDIAIGMASDADPAEWIEFAAHVARASCRLVALVPYGPARWPPELARAFDVVYWDRSTTAGRAASFVRRQPGARLALTALARERGGVRTDGADRLAMLAAFAARADPALLRALRLELAPELETGVEADLWSASYVRFRGPGGLVFDAGGADRLRAQLAAEDLGAYEAAWQVTKRLHRDLPATTRIEEELRYLHRRREGGEAERTLELLRWMIATMVTERPDFAAWAASAVAQLPAEVRNSDEGRMLATAARMRLTERLVDVPELPQGELEDWMAWVVPADREPFTIGVALLDGAIRLSAPRTPYSHPLRLPDTRPLVVEVLERGSALPPRRVELVPETTRRVEIAGDAVLRTADGQVWGLTRSEQPVIEHEELLRRFQPVLRYDSNEQFFADSAAQFTVNPGNELRRKATGDGPGAVIASAQPSRGEPQLTLEFLGPKTYGDGSAVQEGDLIGISGKDYREQYRRLRVAHPDLSDVIYGHAIEANGRLWLQYWLWYFYNDYQLSFALGTHEGDWEMVQVRMDEERREPDIAVYGQHRYGEIRQWGEVEKFGPDAERPVVYVARGSHACYFEAGFHQTEAWYDLADGKRRMPTRPRLEILGTDEPAWTLWPGRWGETIPRDKTLESNSPTGPGAKRQWRNPDTMLDMPSSPKHGRATAGPDVQATRSGGRLQVEYDVSDREPRPHALVVTVNSAEERVPPQTHNIAVHSSGQGKVTTDVVLDPLKRYDVSTSVVAGDPPIPSASTFTEIAAFGRPELTTQQRVLARVSGLIARVRGDRRRRDEPPPSEPPSGASSGGSS